MSWMRLETEVLSLPRPYFCLSYDIPVFQWITSCNKKCYDHTCIDTFAGICNVIDDVRNNNVNFHRKCIHFEGY